MIHKEEIFESLVKKKILLKKTQQPQIETILNENDFPIKINYFRHQLANAEDKTKEPTTLSQLFQVVNTLTIYGANTASCSTWMCPVLP